MKYAPHALAVLLLTATLTGCTPPDTPPTQDLTPATTQAPDSYTPTTPDPTLDTPPAQDSTPTTLTQKTTTLTYNKPTTWQKLPTQYLTGDKLTTSRQGNGNGEFLEIAVGQFDETTIQELTTKEETTKTSTKKATNTPTYIDGDLFTALTKHATLTNTYTITPTVNTDNTDNTEGAATAQELRVATYTLDNHTFTLFHAPTKDRNTPTFAGVLHQLTDNPTLTEEQITTLLTTITLNTTT